MTIAAATLELALEAAPWLLFGLVAAGLIKAFLPARWIAGHLGGADLSAVGKAAVIGAPLPLCSCGVVPAALALRRAGASKASTSSFLVATPETGVETVALSWVLLGPVFAVMRTIAALVAAMSAGWIVGRVEQEPLRSAKRVTADLDAAAHDHAHHDHDHHAHLAHHARAHLDHGPHDHAHMHGAPHQHAPRPAWTRAAEGLAYALGDLWDDIALWIAGGLVLAGAIVTLVPPEALAAWGSGPLAMLLVMLVSVPMYVCASAATPLAHAMLHAGVSPGTVLVFLIAGPATNAASLLLIRRELGGRAMWALVTGVCGAAFAMGLAADALWSVMGWEILGGHAHDHTHDPLMRNLLAWPSLVILMLLAVRPLRRALFGAAARLAPV